MKQLCLLVVIALLLSGCGGGGSSFVAHPETSAGGSGTGGGSETITTTTPGEAQGVYSGDFSSPFSASFDAIVLPNDMFYAIYDDGNCDADFARCGFMVGQGKSDRGTYTATLTNYYWDSGVLSPLTATYVPGASLAGSVTLVNGFTYKVNGTAIPSSKFNYNTPANLANIVGVWPGPNNITITANGTITATGGCSFSGTMTPDLNKNFFSVTLTSGSAPCLYTNQTGSGIAVETLLSDGTTRQLWIFAPVGGWFISVTAQR